ncbi:hypothetical protein HDV06_006795 [Boothiomyces sp. JEL0866]|nr:hypothetical protein HDV06_006795 [Boothiomyces sp. JEL0866]
MFPSVPIKRVDQVEYAFIQMTRETDFVYTECTIKGIPSVQQLNVSLTECRDICISNSNCTALDYKGIGMLPCLMFNTPIYTNHIVSPTSLSSFDKHYCGFKLSSNKECRVIQKVVTCNRFIISRNLECILIGSAYFCPPPMPNFPILSNYTLNGVHFNNSNGSSHYLGSCYIGDPYTNRTSSIGPYSCPDACKLEPTCSGFMAYGLLCYLYFYPVPYYTVNQLPTNVTSLVEKDCPYFSFRNGTCRYHNSFSPKEGNGTCGFVYDNIDCYFQNSALHCDSTTHNTRELWINTFPFNGSVKDDLIVLPNCRIYSLSNGIYNFVKHYECQLKCRSAPDCYSYSWAPWGECMIYSYDMSLTVIVPNKYNWTCGIIESRNNCNFSTPNVTCLPLAVSVTTTLSLISKSTASPTLDSIVLTNLSVPIQESTTIIEGIQASAIVTGGSVILGSDNSPTVVNQINTIATAINLNPIEATPRKTPPVTNPAGTNPNSSDSNLAVNFLLMVIATCILVILGAVATLHIYYKPPKESVPVLPTPQLIDHPELNPRSPFKYTSQSIRFISSEFQNENNQYSPNRELEPVIYSRSSHTNLSNIRKDASKAQLSNVASSAVSSEINQNQFDKHIRWVNSSDESIPPLQNTLKQYQNIVEALKTIPVNSFEYTDEKSIYLFTGPEGIPLFVDLIQSLIFRTSYFKATHEYQNNQIHIHAGEYIQVTKHLHDGFFLYKDSNLPISLIPSENLPNIILELALDGSAVNLDHPVINCAIEYYPEKILINIIPDFKSLSPSNYIHDKLFKSISDSKKILIRGEQTFVESVATYLDGITDNIWIYFDKTVVNDEFRIENRLKSYNPFL